MAAEFLGGLGNFATSFMKGYEQAEDREAALKERQFLEGQRQRKLDEQRRADELRVADANVQTTEDVEVPGTKTIYGKEASVVRDDEGNLMPGAVDTPATTVKRRRSWDSIYRDYAANRQKAGDTAGALEFTDKANKVSAQRAANAFLQVQADAGSKTPLQLAQEIGKIFDSDPMNGGTKSIEELPDGGVRMTLFNKDTGQTSTREFKGPKAREELMAAFTPYFRPESYAKLLDKQSEIAAEIAKDPYKQVAGGYIDKRTGKFTATMVGQDVIGYNADGSPIYGSRGQGTGTGSGSGSKKGAKTPVDEAGEILKDSMGGKGDGSPEGAARYTRAQSYLDGIYTSNPSISPRTAAAIAADASADPTKITMQLDNRTGQVSKVYANPDFEGGRQFNLGPNSGTVAEMEKVVGKSGMQQAVSGMVSQLASAVPPEQQQAFQQQLIQAATDPKLREQVLAAAKEGGQDVQAMNRQLDLIKAYAAPAPGPGRNTRTNVGGIKMPTTDPNSPAGRAQARQAQLRADADAKEAQRLEDQKKLSAQFRADARTLSGIELERKYDSMRGQLPREDQIELRRLAAQAYRSAQ